MLEESTRALSAREAKACHVEESFKVGDVSVPSLNIQANTRSKECSIQGMFGVPSQLLVLRPPLGVKLGCYTYAQARVASCYHRPRHKLSRRHLLLKIAKTPIDGGAVAATPHPCVPEASTAWLVE